MALLPSSRMHAVHSSQYVNRGPDTYEGLHALVPVILGLSVPLILLSPFAAVLQENLERLPVYGLVPVALLAGLAFLISIVAAGTVTHALFDPRTRMVEMVRLGPLANSRWRIPFTQIASVRLVASYDADGAKSLRPLIELKSGEHIELPAETTWNDIEIFRRLLAGEDDAIHAAWARKREQVSSLRGGLRGRRD